MLKKVIGICALFTMSYGYAQVSHLALAAPVPLAHRLHPAAAGGRPAPRRGDRPQGADDLDAGTGRRLPFAGRPCRRHGRRRAGRACLYRHLCGDDHLLQYWLRKFDLPKIWDGKVVATSSAGSDAMVKYFWTCDWRKNMDGLGILPIKFLPHFKSAYGDDDSRGPIEWDGAYEELKKYKEDLPIYALKEGEFVVINQ